MNPVSGSLTEANLIRVFALKSQIINKYEYFSKQAKKDGFEQISAVFAEVAEQQRNHVKTIYRLLEGCKARVPVEMGFGSLLLTLDNLKDAVESETEVASLLSAGTETAWTEGFKAASTKMKLFRQISESYVEKFSKFVQNIEEDKVFKKDEKVRWICRKCGLIYESEKALKNCPGCEHPQAYFEVMAENY